jgi:hypothetical protein
MEESQWYAKKTRPAEERTIPNQLAISSRNMIVIKKA